jgi:GTP-binding protein YchF
MKLGIAGLAGAGKSTVFAALTRTELDPGLRAEDRIGTVSVPDERIDALSAMYRPRKTIYAQVEYLLPGIGGAKSEGREPEAWTPLRDCDALIHVIRNFRQFGVEEASPAEDFTAFDQELILADLVVVEKRLERLEAERQRGRKFDAEEYALLSSCREILEREEPLRQSPEIAQARPLKGFSFLSAKPLLALFNNEDDDDALPSIDAVTGTEVCMVLRGKLEQELSLMPEQEALEFMEEFDISATATDRVIRKSYAVLGRVSFFTVGDDEVRAWTIPEGTEAVEAAGVIHTDMKKGFIRAEIVSYADLMEAGTYAEARKRGTVRLEGKTYLVQDGDIATFRFNV